MEELFYEMKSKQDEELFSMIGFSSLYTSPFHQEIDSFSFPISNYPLEYALHDQPVVIPDSPLSTDFHQLPPAPPLPRVQVAADTVVEMKKKNHNASERMRRMKLNRLFDALRSVLPGADHMKKLGAPSTVENVIKYIPELRMEVEALIQKKQQLVTTMTTNTTTNDVVFSAAPSAWTNNNTTPSSSLASFASWSVQVTKLGNAEFSIQISSPKSLINTFIPIAEVLRKLEEEDGLFVIEFSSSDSSAGRIFYYMHLIKEEEANEIDCERLRKKLIFSCQQWEKMCLWMITQG